MKASDLKLTGPECVKVGMNCLAPNEDAAYFMGKRLWLPDNQRVYAVIGALGTQTKNATYVGLGLNSSANQLGFDNIEDDTLAGTANEYTDVPNHERFFLYYFARDCTGLETLDQRPAATPSAISSRTVLTLILTLRIWNARCSSSPCVTIFSRTRSGGRRRSYTLNPVVITLQRPQETE